MSKCGICGVESSFDGGFIKERKSFSKTTRLVCPTCWVRRRNWWESINLLLNLAAGLAGIICHYVAPTLPLGRFLLTLFLIQLFLVATVLPHELGHAIVARLLGWRVFKIAVGVGKLAGKATLCGIRFEFRWLPIGGITLMTPIELHWFRVKRFLIVLAGPIVNAAMAAGVLLIWRGDMNRFNILELPLAPRLFLCVNILVLAFNLWPHDSKGSFRIPSDGKQLMRAFSFKKSAQEELKAMRFLLEANMAREANDPLRAREWCEQGLASHPENLALLNFSGIVHLDLLEFVPARDVFLKLIAKEKKPGLNRFVFLNNAAYAGALTGNPELLAEADAYSKEAYAGMPWQSFIIGTRGTVLVEMGDYEAGTKLLKEAYEMAESPHSKAENACHIAIARAKAGDRDQAEKFLEIAKQIDPLCRLISRSERELETVRSLLR
jgi:hypothetical protein